MVWQYLEVKNKHRGSSGAAVESVVKHPILMPKSRVEEDVRSPRVLPFSLAQYPRTEVEEIQGVCSMLRSECKVRGVGSSTSSG